MEEKSFPRVVTVSRRTDRTLTGEGGRPKIHDRDRTGDRTRDREGKRCRAHPEQGMGTGVE